jgi:hypothetical protein
MEEVIVEKKELDTKSLIGCFASETDCKIEINSDCKLFIGGDLSLVYLKDATSRLGSIDNLRECLGDFNRWHAAKRMTKLKPVKSICRVFGYQPRNALRNRPCSVATISVDDPSLSSALLRTGVGVSGVYSNICEKEFGNHLNKIGGKISKEYVIGETPFTSGIVNKSGRLPYHFDRGNVAECWSAMLGISSGITGGYLCIPEIDCRLKISDGSLCFFNGQGLLHGVSKFRRTRPDAERYTIVWYSLESLWKCLTKKEEIADMNNRQRNLISRKADRIRGKAGSD